MNTQRYPIPIQWDVCYLNRVKMERQREKGKEEANSQAEKKHRDWPKELQQQSEECLMNGWMSGYGEGVEKRAV